GHVVDMPFEPACLPLKIKAYPVEELAGLIFAYLGPEPAPLLPRWDLLVRTDMNKTITPTLLPCNWLQCMDNSLDPAHFEHLHGVYGNYVMERLGQPPMLHPARHVKIDFEVFEYGIYKRRLLEGQAEDTPDWTVGHPILFPNILAQGNPDRMGFQFRVPVDDAHTLDCIVDAVRPKEGEPLWEAPVVRSDPLVRDDSGRIVATYINRQDEMAWVGQGPISDRTTEHLVTSDKGILLYRKVLLENIEKVKRGEDPMGTVRDEATNNPMIRIARVTEYAAFIGGVANEDYGGVRELFPSTRRTRMPGGYMGKILKVDLSSGRHEDLNLPEEPILRQYWGGQALATYFLMNLIRLDAKPFDADAPIVMMTGPVTGTGL